MNNFQHEQDSKECTERLEIGSYEIERNTDRYEK